MKPVTLTTARLVLDQPGIDDIDLTTTYCQDPIFERYLTTPWPYRRENAVGFLIDYVPRAWEDGTEFTWAVRVDGEFAGLIGFRTGRGDLGYWLGAPHRGVGYMTEATGAVLDWLFEHGYDDIQWECLVGNGASVSVARKLGFTFTGEAPSLVTARDGSHPTAWHGILRAADPRRAKPGWPTTV